jgi:hypothetical protein
MMQSPEQMTEQKAHLWKPGQSGNPRGREGKAKREARIDAIVADWAGSASLTPAERDLLRYAAGLLLSHPKTSEDKVRVLNCVARALAQCGLVDNRRKREPAAPTLAEYLARKNAAPEATP